MFMHKHINTPTSDSNVWMLDHNVGPSFPPANNQSWNWSDDQLPPKNLKREGKGFKRRNKGNNISIINSSDNLKSQTPILVSVQLFYSS